MMKILDYLDRDKVMLGLKPGGKKDVIETLVSFLMKTGASGDSGKIVKALLDREKTGSTGIGNGVAIPHSKTDAVDSVRVVYAYSPDGVDYDSVDCKPANFFFMVVSPPSEASVQLRLLARISRLMGNRMLRNELKGADTPEKAIEAIRRYDE